MATSINIQLVIFMEKTKLPKSFIRQSNVNVEIEKLQQQIEGVNRAIKVFISEDLPVDLEFLRQYAQTQADFRTWVTVQEAAYTAQLGFLPKKEKERIHSSFAELADRVESARNTIGVFLSGAKYPIRQELDGSIAYDWDAVRQAIERKNTYVYSDEDKEYFQVLSEARAALLRIATWELEHTYAPIARVFPNVGRLLAADFSAGWFQANIGRRIGKSSAAALKMIREQEED